MKAQHCTVLFLSVLCELQMIKSFSFLVVEKSRYKSQGLEMTCAGLRGVSAEQGIKTWESWLFEAGSKS